MPVPWSLRRFLFVALMALCVTTCGGGAVTLPASCSDGIRDGAETAVDCGGGTCAACAAGATCALASDCISNFCSGGTCQASTCADGVKNGSETAVDCGGAQCPACGAGLSCSAASDCVSAVCTSGACVAASCSDGVKNGSETDIDCGGGTCAACASGKRCGAAADCSSQVCDSDLCQAPTCFDHVKNGAETDVDCGGGACQVCANGKGCAAGSDCTSHICQGGMCAVASCADGIKNGSETDVDCGGGLCGPCANGKACVAASDCTSDVCTGLLCQAPTCSDGIKNGAETDVDCGGGTCAACTSGKVCGANSDCASGLCKAGKCADAISCLTLLTANPAAKSGVYEIDPDGSGAGLAPFSVYCDMTTAGGGWTLLPLLFNNASYWAITHPGNSCITVDIQDNSGDYRQYFSSATGSFSQTYMKFVPPIPVTTIQFVSFLYTNSGSLNSMDFTVNAVPSGASTSYEGWYFVNAALAPVGYAFSSQAQCVAQGNGEGNYEFLVNDSPQDCSRDNQEPNIATALYDMNETVTLSATVPNFNMALVQGCGSALTAPLSAGEQFHVATPPNANGIWQTGIMVR